MRKSMLATAAVLAVVAVAEAAGNYNAICDTPPHNQTWMGPTRPTYAEAKKDCDAHVKQYPGHSCAAVGSP